MTKVKDINGIKFDYPLFIKEEFNLKTIKGKAFNTLNGGKIVYETIKRNSGNYITLISKDSGWVSEKTLNKILILLDDLGVETYITTTDNIQIKVRPAVEIGEVIKTNDVINENGGWFKVEIALCRI